MSNLLWSLGLQPSREEVEDLLVEMDADRLFLKRIFSDTCLADVKLNPLSVAESEDAPHCVIVMW